MLFLCLYNHTIKQSSFFCSNPNHLCDKPFARFVRFELCPMLSSLFISKTHAFIQASVRKCKSRPQPEVETALYFLLDLCRLCKRSLRGVPSFVSKDRDTVLETDRDKRINIIVLG